MLQAGPFRTPVAGDSTSSDNPKSERSHVYDNFDGVAVVFGGSAHCGTQGFTIT
jgi:hypothetical protein